MTIYKQIPDNAVLEAQITRPDGEKEEKQMSGYEYNNIISWIPLMRSLGGSETVRYEYYCKYGYKVVQKLVSISPKGLKTIYVFKF